MCGIEPTAREIDSSHWFNHQEDWGYICGECWRFEQETTSVLEQIAHGLIRM